MPAGLAWILGIVGIVGALEPAPVLPADLLLVWQAPPECPSREFVERAIAEKLVDVDGVPRSVAARAVVQATLTQDHAGYRLDLRIAVDGAVVERVLHAEQCELLARAAGLVVGIALDPAVPVAELEVVAVIPDPPAEPEVRDPVDDPVNDPVNDRARAVPEVRLQAVTPARRARPSIGGALRVAGGLDGGMLPGPGAGVAVSAAVFGEAWRASLHGSRWFPRARAFVGEPNVGADFQGWSGGGRGCFVPHAFALEFPVCSGVELAQVHATGFGPASKRDVRSLWLGAALAGGVEWVVLPWLGLHAGLEGFAALRRPAFTAPGRPTLYRATPLAVRALAGVALRLGGPDRAARKNRRRPPQN